MKRLLCVLLSLLFWNSAFACTGYRNDVWILVNMNSEDSKEIGRYYAEQRCINPQHIIPIFAQVTHEISTAQYNGIRSQITIFLQNQIYWEQYGDFDYDPAVQILSGIGGGGPDAYMNYIRLHISNNYFVTIKDLPYRTFIPVPGDNGGEPASLDAALAKEFNVALARLDGLTKETAKNLVDRAIRAEQEGVAGKFHIEPFENANLPLNPLPGYSPIKTFLPFDQTNATLAHRYVLGVANESRPECAGSDASIPFYLLSPSVKPPVHCTVKFIGNKKLGLNNTRNSLADNALMYFGYGDGQEMYWPEFDSAVEPIEDTGTAFLNVLNWKKDANSSPCGLCKDSTNPELCRQQSTDVYKEIDTQCVGVANGFMGYNFQSYPVAFMASWPTGWGFYNGGHWTYEGSGDEINVALPEVITNDGDGDNFSLKFSAANKNQERCMPFLHLSSNLSVCDNPKRRILLQQRKNLSAFHYTPLIETNGSVGQKFSLTGRYKYKPATTGEVIAPRIMLGMQLREKNTVLGFTSGNAYNTNNPGNKFIDLQNTGGTWQNFSFEYIHNADTAVARDKDNHVITQSKPSNEVIYDGIRLALSSQLFTGELQFDNFNLADQQGDSLPLINGDFSQGHLQSSLGDHASFFLSRLDGTAYLGSMSHYIQAGHALTDSYSSFMKMYRGKNLGEATKLDLIKSGSGLVYGDPLFSPAGVRIDAVPTIMWSNTTYNITGSARNGMQTGQVTLDYCEGTDFFICDKDRSWRNIATRYGATENTTLFTTTLPNMTGESRQLILRLQVNAIVDGKESVLNDFATARQVIPGGDINHNGISNIWENFMGFDFDHFTDTNNNSLDDAWEVAHFSTAAEKAAIDQAIASGLANTLCNSSCVNLRLQRANPDLNQNGVSDYWESFLGLDTSRFNDLDHDALDDGWELFNFVTPQELSSINQAIVFEQPNTLCDSNCVNQIIQRATTYGASKVPGLDNLTVATLHVDSVVTTIQNAQLYVDELASSLPNRDGTEARPFATIAEASKVLKELKGGAVILAPGHYEYTAELSSGFTMFVAKNGASSVDVEVCVRAASSHTSLRLAPKDLFFNLTIKRCSGTTATIAAYNNSFYSVKTEGTFRFYLKDNVLTNSIVYRGWLIMDSNAHLQISSSTLVSQGPPNVINYSSFAERLLISNSILYNLQINGKSINGISAPGYVQYNLLSDGLYNGVSGNFKADPLFVNQTIGDFHVKPTSPTINKGNPSDDCSLEPLPNGGVIDLGAYGNTPETPTN